jgi:uncharacterized membrane protein YqaE (UPF0057 family)
MPEVSEQKLLLIIIAILIPPLAVGLKRGIGGALILNIILTVLFYLPGLLHALYVILA